jgi:hypothetical protein
MGAEIPLNAAPFTMVYTRDRSLESEDVPPPPKVKRGRPRKVKHADE